MKSHHIESIHLKNFRSYADIKLDFNKNIIIFFGENASGKTSILEAIYMGNLIKSFRESKDANLIQWSQSFYNITIKGRKEEKPFKVYLGYGYREKPLDGKAIRVLKVNDKVINKVKDFISSFHCVVFAPDDIRIIDTTPLERRKYFDTLLASLSVNYFEHLQRYKKVLKVRNSYLRNIKHKKVSLQPSYLQVYNKQLAESGSYIIQSRVNLIKELDILFLHYIKEFSSSKDHWNLKYKPSIEDNNEEKFLSALQSTMHTDIQIGQTTKGIHKDNFLFIEPNTQKELLTIASQGQKRTVALALKMAQYDFTKKQTKITPILLVDDILTELDLSRKKQFISLLNNLGQVFITTTDISSLENFLEQSNIQNSTQIFSFSKTNSVKTDITQKMIYIFKK